MTLSVDISSSRIKLPIFTVDYNVSTSGRPSFKVATDDDIRGWFIKSNSYSTYKTSGAILICSQSPDPNYRQNVTYRMIPLQPWKDMDRRRQYREMALHNPDMIKNLDIDISRQELEGVFDIEQRVKQLMNKQTQRQQFRTRFLKSATVTIPESSWLVSILNLTQYDHLPGVIEFKKIFIENCQQLFPNFIGSSRESKDILSRIAITNQKFKQFEQIPNTGPKGIHTILTNHSLYPQGIDNYDSIIFGARPAGRTQKSKVNPPTLNYHNQLSCICSQNISFTDPIRCMSDMILVLGLLYDGFDLLFNHTQYRSAYSKAKFIYEDNQGITVLHQLTGERPPDKSFDLLYVMNIYSLIAKDIEKPPQQSKKIQKTPPINPGYIVQPSAPPLPAPTRQKLLQRRAKLERFLDNVENYEFTNPQRIRQLEKQLQELRKL